MAKSNTDKKIRIASAIATFTLVAACAFAVANVIGIPTEHIQGSNGKDPATEWDMTLWNQIDGEIRVKATRRHYSDTEANQGTESVYDFIIDETALDEARHAADSTENPLGNPSTDANAKSWVAYELADKIADGHEPKIERSIPKLSLARLATKSASL